MHRWLVPCIHRFLIVKLSYVPQQMFKSTMALLFLLVSRILNRTSWIGRFKLVDATVGRGGSECRVVEPRESGVSCLHLHVRGVCD